MTQERDLEREANRGDTGGQQPTDNTTWNPGGSGNSDQAQQDGSQGSGTTWNPGGTGNATGDQSGSVGDEPSGERPTPQPGSEGISENTGASGTGNGEDGTGSSGDTGRFRDPEGSHSPSSSGGGD